MSDSDSSANGSPTRPDPIDPGARAQIVLLHGEQIMRSWRTGLGFLVMTNLRCVHVWRRPELFVASEWHSGPTFFFYNLAPPQVVAGRFVKLTEEFPGSVDAARFLVRNPQDVCREIEEARAAGQAEWQARRIRAQQELHRPRRPLPPVGTTVVIREVVKVRCNFCGNLMDIADRSCPSCGAPQR